MFKVLFANIYYFIEECYILIKEIRKYRLSSEVYTFKIVRASHMELRVKSTVFREDGTEIRETWFHIPTL